MFESLKDLLKHFTGSQNTESEASVASNQESESLAPATFDQITESTIADSSSLQAESTELATNPETTQVSTTATINQETESVSSESQFIPSDNDKSDI